MSLGWVKSPRDRLLVRLAMVAIPLAACVPLWLAWRTISAWPTGRFWLTAAGGFVVMVATLILGIRLNERRGAFDRGRLGVVVGGWMWLVGTVGAFACIAAAMWRGIDSFWN